MTVGNIWLFETDDGNFIRFIRAQAHTDADGFRTVCCPSRPVVLELPAGTTTRKDEQWLNHAPLRATELLTIRPGGR